ncbi:BLOC-2 complex member HPS6 [Chelonoidis abingdonii]|uniref:HPS6 biosis of lysosomal organelles complex 2 subunit 3 n=1 Tax=Chelonoidis abingdonii TaxID=106734 RepID=A0A8C0G1U5_CHEAB|nr:Hermansky-Pudlak syndrome 6 protein [Chelonoidis abingdonii]
MKRAGELQQVSDFSDFVSGRRLRELLSQRGPGEAPHHVQASPDGQHLLLLLRGRSALQPQVLAFPRLGTSPGDLERSWQPSQPPIVGLLFLQSPAALTSWVLAVIWEQGRTEVWGFMPVLGWQLHQSLELCHGARARIVSICSQGSSLVWCEERPPSAAHLDPGRGAFRYCICTRALEVGEQGAHLGAMRIVVHNSPPYQVLASPQHVFLVPTVATFASISTFLLIWCPWEAKVTIVAPSGGFVHSEVLHSSDFKKLVFGSVGLLLSVAPLDIHTCALSSCGGLLLLSTQGTVHLVQPDGTWRHVYDLGGSCLAQGDPVQLKAFGSTLACVLAGVLYLIDLTSGRLIEKKLLSTKEVHFLGSPSREEEIQLLTPMGIYCFSFSSLEEGGRPEPTLVEMVFEEACKYYQRRSLSSSQLTVEKLKKGDMFQAPIALSSILQHSLPTKERAAKVLPETYAKLLSTLSMDLQSYLSLELLKSCIVSASESEVDRCCEELVEQEVSRLLRLDLDRENLAYLNAVFNSFPKASWKAIRGSLQLQQNGDGLLVARTTSDIWKKVLGGPVPHWSQQEEIGLNGVVPLFELICGSLHRFKPKWLPRFVELTQQYVGASWTYSTKEGPEGGVPLYKRALAVLDRQRHRTANERELEIELLLCSTRPKAVLQAVQLLIRLRRWQRVVEAAEKFSKLSPLLNKEIFTTLLAQFAQHRDLDPYLAALWELCPADLTVSDILSIVLQHLPSSAGDPAPFCTGGVPLTLALLKPLLHKVAQCQCTQDELYADILQGPPFPPPAPPRQHRAGPKAAPGMPQQARACRAPFPGCNLSDAV